MNSVRIYNLEIRDEVSTDPQLPYAVYDHEHYTGQTRINYPVLIARFNNRVAATQWANMVAGDEDEDDEPYEDIDDSMDGDHKSGLASAGYGNDEDYGYYGDGDY